MRSELRHIAGLSAALLCGCGAPSDENTAATHRSALVVGVTMDDALATQSTTLRIVSTAETGELLADRTVLPAELPLELVFDGLPARTRVVNELTANDNSGVLVTRIAETSVVAKRTLLLPVRLNDECIPDPDEPDVSCANMTCSAGVCTSRYVHPETLSDYAPDWHIPDDGTTCPGSETTPVVVGHGELPFSPLLDGEILVAEAGTQGLAHVFLSVRAHRIRSDGTTTYLTAVVLDSGVSLYPHAFGQPFTLTDDGCELSDLMFVLPGTWNTTLRIGATVVDDQGDAQRNHVNIFVQGPATTPGT